MIEIMIGFMVWGFICYKIGFNRGLHIGIVAGIHTTVELVSKVITIEQIIEITKLANKMVKDVLKTKTGE